MIATWMPYAVAVSLIFGLAGMALEQSLRLARLPGRWGVAAALLGSILVPIVTREAPASAQETLTPAVLSDPFGVAAQGLQTIPTSIDLGALDLPLVGLWIAGAFLALGLVIGTQLRVLKDARECSESVVHGVRVRRTRSFGPATVGCVKSFIVLPAWADHLDAESVRLMVLHEREHLNARDPQLLFAALVLTALQPWNLALWWQLRRLRNAIELDCDQRVLATGADILSYVSLLLRFAASRAPTRVAALALANTKTFMARRVRTMADHTAKSKYVKASFAALFAVSLVVLGCETPSPVQVEGPAQPVLVGETPGVDGDIRVQSEHGISANPLVEYRVTAERIDEVLQYLREEGVSRAIRDGGEVRVKLRPILLRLWEEGALQEMPPSDDPPLSFLFETRDGAPLGLIRLYEEEREPRVLLFKTIPLPGGN
jgi:beta-lactamase regulating signal transducer with metallopeptidase domain